MRKRFEQQLELGALSIERVELDLKSRHELLPLLSGLQYIFKTVSLSESIFGLLEKEIVGDKKATGRLGMSLWEILVMGVVRLGLDVDYDMLHSLVNNHSEIRGILGIEREYYLEKSTKKYHLQTIKDNVSLLSEELLMKINLIVVKGGHEIKKKRRQGRKFCWH